MTTSAVKTIHWENRQTFDEKFLKMNVIHA